MQFQPFPLSRAARRAQRTLKTQAASSPSDPKMLDKTELAELRWRRMGIASMAVTRVASSQLFLAELAQLRGQVSSAEVDVTANPGPTTNKTRNNQSTTWEWVHIGRQLPDNPLVGPPKHPVARMSAITAKPQSRASRRTRTTRRTTSTRAA